MNHGPGLSPSIVKILATAPIASFDPFSRSSLFYALCSLFSGNILDNGKVQCSILSCNGRNAFYPFLVLQQTYNISNSLTIEVTKPREIHFDESLFWQTQFRRFFSNQSMTLRNCSSLRYTAIRETTLWVFLSRKTKIASKRSRHRQTYAILAGALKIPGTCRKKWRMTFVSCRGRDRGFGHRRNMYPVCHVLVTLNHRKRELTLSLSLSGRFSFSCVEKLLSVVNNEIVYWISQWNLGNANFEEKVRILELWSYMSYRAFRRVKKS